MDNLHYEKFADGTIKCIEDEIPFEVPESWGWERIRNIGTIIRGNGIKRSEIIEDGFPCVRYGEIYTTYNISFRTTNSFISEEVYGKSKRFSHGDILMTLTGENKPDIAKAVAYLGKQRVAASGDLAVWTAHGMYPLYLSYLLAAPYLIDQKIQQATGNIIVHISGEKIGGILITIPPLNEQKRIVQKVQELEIALEEYQEKEHILTNLQCIFPDTLKKSVLQWAVQGKLVQQDENDEPATVLLERIRAEKEELIRQGKIKRDKRESVIYRGTDNSYYERFADGSEKCIDEEIQFDIPEHWVWCRLREITLSIRDGSHNPPPDNGSGIPLLSGVNIDNNFINIHSATRWITQSEWEIENRRTNIECGDVLLTIVGTIGRSAVVETDEHFALQRSVAVLKPCQIFSVYLMNVLQAPTTQRWFSNNGKGTAQKGIYLNMLYKLMIPIPPLQEQVKISEALNVLMDRINDIENQIA